MIDTQTNPIFYACIGGLILGVATSFNYTLRGKVTGMSGMIYGVVSLNKKQIPQKISTIGGMLAMSAIFFMIFEYGSLNGFTPFGPKAKILSETSYLGYAVAGLLVGFGTKLSNGCTSGHGLCGLARFSIRSFVAVMTFMTTSILISSLRHYFSLGFLGQQKLQIPIHYNHTIISAAVILAVGVLLPTIGGLIRLKWSYQLENEPNFNQLQQNEKQYGKYIILDQLLTFIVGVLFGAGLLVSGMVRRVNIMSFLEIGTGWNPSLLFVLACGILVNLVFFTYMRKIKKHPFFGGKLFDPNNTKIDAPLIIGATCFGLGWGIGGICPGPAVMLTGVWNIPVHIIWFGCLLIGMLMAYYADKMFFSIEVVDQASNLKNDIYLQVPRDELARGHK